MPGVDALLGLVERDVVGAEPTAARTRDEPAEVARRRVVGADRAARRRSTPSDDAPRDERARASGERPPSSVLGRRADADATPTPRAATVTSGGRAAACAACGASISGRPDETVAGGAQRPRETRSLDSSLSDLWPRRSSYGGETKKAVDNFPISGETVPALGHPLARRASRAPPRTVNGELGLIDKRARGEDRRRRPTRSPTASTTTSSRSTSSRPARAPRRT